MGIEGGRVEVARTAGAAQIVGAAGGCREIGEALRSVVTGADPTAVQHLPGPLPTDRVAVRQEWVDRTVPRFLDIPGPPTTDWATAHGDLHTANLTAATPYLLDWEGFGLAPVGYDAAMLLAYSLLTPAFAHRVRDAFPVLKTEPGRAAQIIVITELLQSASRGDRPELVPALRLLATELS